MTEVTLHALTDTARMKSTAISLSSSAKTEERNAVCWDTIKPSRDARPKFVR